MIYRGSTRRVDMVCRVWGFGVACVRAYSTERLNL